ncbi:prepilin peptidase [Aquincola sp. MAHUQ-54]|uniref:Protein translocase subunit SecA n=1 Tax=Aquincola agrisoli TaxID=3119538 RepID=A0AAW9QHK2_9BURK
MAAVLPRPGVVLGAYPQRSGAAEPAWLRWWRSQGTLRTCLCAPRWRAGRRHRRFVAGVLAEAQALAALPETLLRQRLQAVRTALAREGLGSPALPQAFALVRETTRRQLGLAHFDTQIIAARVMLDGRIAEMATGEGKTLSALLAAAVAALAGIPVHVITANDYLVARDAERLRPVYEALGLRVGHVTQPMPPAERARAYGCDLTYCTARELVFDYLRDRMAGLPADSDLQRRAALLAGRPSAGGQPLLRGLCMALVDEADSILIDEATTPLILSRAHVDPGDVEFCRQALRVAGLLRAACDYRLDAGSRQADLTDRGRAAVAAHGRRLGGRWCDARDAAARVAMALAARHLYRADRDYLLRDGRVVLIDETTGRVADGRVWSHGLQTLIELKEGCEPTGVPQTLAQITYQRFFPRYLKLGGMSGTVRESRAELLATYGLAVQPIPLRRPCRRDRWPTRLYERDEDRWRAVVAEVARLHALGRPVLVGTDSVAESERLAACLAAAGLPHAVLNARHDHAEAEVVAAAGGAGCLTVATNMAGRGTDIPVPQAVEAVGGLHVLACQHNVARRVDRQLAGRCARQGQRGSVQRWLALEAGLFARHPGWTALARAIVRAAPGRVVAGWCADLLAAVPQRRAERSQARQRALLAQQDAAMDRGLSLGGEAE